MKPPSYFSARDFNPKSRLPENDDAGRYRDENGHMNMRWYLAIFDDAGDVLHDRIGLSREYHSRHKTGTFDLEHHLHFLSEVNPADEVAVYMRFVARSAKRLHYLMFMVNVTQGRLAAIFECMNTFADLTMRKTAPFPEEIVREDRRNS